MIWINIMLGIAAGLIVFTLLTPLILQVDTTTNRYLIRLLGIGCLRVLPDAEYLIKIRYRVFSFERSFYPLVGRKRKAKTETKRKKKAGGSWKMSKQMRRRIFNTLKSFELKEFSLDLDTGDYIWNAFMHPAFYFMSSPNRMLNVNYIGRNAAKITVKNRLIRIIYSFIK